MLKLFYKFIKNPVSRSRLDRFRAIRRANWSFNILLILFLLSLISELVCNNKPLIVSYESKLYFPIFKFYSQDSFLKNGIYNKVNYKEFQKYVEEKKTLTWGLKQ